MKCPIKPQKFHYNLNIKGLLWQSRKLKKLTTEEFRRRTGVNVGNIESIGQSLPIGRILKTSHVLGISTELIVDALVRDYANFLEASVKYQKEIDDLTFDSE